MNRYHHRDDDAAPSGSGAVVGGDEGHDVNAVGTKGLADLAGAGLAALELELDGGNDAPEAGMRVPSLLLM